MSCPTTSRLGAPEQFLDYEKSLACIHCGLCLSSCPTYLETGNENDSPRGRIYLMRAMQEGRLALGDAPVRHVDLCLGCRACEAVCPSGVQYGELLEATRDHVERHHERPLWQQMLRHWLIEKVFPYPERMELALMPAQWVKQLRMEGWLPRFARDALALIPETMSAVRLPTMVKTQRQKSRGRVGFVSGCVMSVMFGETNAATVRLITRAGFDVVTPTEQGCCGALFAHGGNLEEARASARRNIAAFEQAGVDLVLINAAGCGSTLKEYARLLRADPGWADRAALFSAKVRDLTEWLCEIGERYMAANPPAGPVTYHDACHLAHAQRIDRAPRALVRAVAGEAFVELRESSVCCGSAGSYNLTEPEMASQLQQRKTGNILKTGARTVVTTNPGCLLQMRAGLRRAKAHDVEVLHIADYLDREARRADGD